MRFNLRLIHKGIILVSVPLLFELGFVGVLFQLYSQAEAEAIRSQHAKEVSDCVSQMTKTIVSVFKQFDNANVLLDRGLDTQGVRRKIAELHDLLRNLKELTKDNRRQSDIVADSTSQVMEIERLMLEVGDAYEQGHGQQAADILRINRKLVQRHVKILGASELLSMAQEQQDLQDRSPAVQAEYRRMVKIVLFAALLFNIALALVLAFFFSRGISRRVAVLTDNSLRLAQGKPLHQLVSGSDEIAHLDKVFHSMAEALEQAELSKQEMIGMVTHDLKTPLTTVSALLEMLEEGMFGTLNEQGLNNLRVVSRNVTRMNGLIRDLLDVEKIKSGKLALFREDISVIEVLEEAAESVRGLAADRNIKISVKADDIQADADYQRMQQVLINLLSNAIKFSPDGSEIILGGTGDGKFVHFTVQDQGRGIPANMLKAVFERFEQTKVSDATVKGGTGLGPAICRALVELHGGEIGVTSQEGKGSTFFFTIPVATDVDLEDVAKAPSVLPAGG